MLPFLMYVLYKLIEDLYCILNKERKYVYVPNYC